MLEERVTDQVYSLDDERFLPDRYIIGTCPHCGYERANGDQCENCARLLEPSDLINPRSAISGSTRLEVRATRHLFIRQSLMAGRVREWIDSHTDWPILVTSIARNWHGENVRRTEDRSITRDLKWGIPVGWPGFEGKVFYVWFDAPIEYIGATKEWADLEPDARDWRSWWFNATDVRYTQFLGKDNIPFHTINFPITIMGSGEPWKLVDYVKGFNYLTYYGGKFSTSQHRGVFMDAAIDLLPADYWRYALLASAPESDDAEFTWESFALTVNKDLAGIFGNFVQRTLKLTEKLFGTTVPDGGEPGPEEAEGLAGSLLDTALAAYAGDGTCGRDAASDPQRLRCAASGIARGISTSIAARPGTRPTTPASPASCGRRSTSRASRQSCRRRSSPSACDRLAATLGLEEGRACVARSGRRGAARHSAPAAACTRATRCFRESATGAPSPPGSRRWNSASADPPDLSRSRRDSRLYNQRLQAMWSRASPAQRHGDRWRMERARRRSSRRCSAFVRRSRALSMRACSRSSLRFDSRRASTVGSPAAAARTAHPGSCSCLQFRKRHCAATSVRSPNTSSIPAPACSTDQGTGCLVCR